MSGYRFIDPPLYNTHTQKYCRVKGKSLLVKFFFFFLILFEITFA